jgi:ABC-type transport system substrate-binding protein
VCSSDLINVKLTVVETAQFSTFLAQKKFRGYIFSASTPLAFADAEQVLWLYWLKIGTWGMWQDDKIIDMYNKIHVETDLATRTKLLRESDAYMYEQLPMVNLVHTHAIFAVNKRIDFKPTPGNYNVDPSRRITWMPGY